MVQSKGSAEQRISTLEQTTNSNFSEIERRLNELLKFEERAKNNFLEVERKLVQFEKMLEGKIGEASKVQPSAETTARFDEFAKRTEDEILELQRRMVEFTHKPAVVGVDTENVESRLTEKIKSLEDILMLLELEIVRMRGHEAPSPEALTSGIPTESEDRLRILEEKIGVIEKINIKVPAELVNHEPRMKTMEENIIALQRRMKEEYNRLENMMGGRAVSETSIERFIQKMQEEMGELKTDIEKAKMLKDEILIKEKSLATKPELAAFESKLSSEVEHMHRLTDKISAAEKSIDSKLVDIEDSLKTQLDTHVRSFDSRIADLESALRTGLDAHRRAFDTQIANLEEFTAKVAMNVAASESRRGTDTIMQRVNSFEKDLENKALSVVSKEIMSFAEAIDKKFPELATKEDFHIWAKSVEEKVRSIEAPDVGNLAERMDIFEIRLNEIGNILRSISDRMPVIVE